MLICASALSILTGCAAPDDPPPPRYLDFCKFYEVRIFSHKEFDTRMIVGPANLRRDITENETHEKYCIEGGASNAI